MMTGTELLQCAAAAHFSAVLFVTLAAVL